MKEINITRSQIIEDTTSNNYKMVVEVLSAEEVDREVFVKQRRRNTKQQIVDEFVAVASPTQLEELDINSPATGSSYFRTSKIELVSAHPAYIEEVFKAILGDIQMLVDDLNVMNSYEIEAAYTITPGTTPTDLTMNEQTIPMGAKSFTIEQPNSTEDFIVFFTNNALKITKLVVAIEGSNPSLTWTIKHGPHPEATGHELISGGKVTTANGLITTFNKPDIAKDSFVWFQTSSIGGVVSEFHITMFFN